MNRNECASEFDEFYNARSAGLVRSIYLRTGDLSRAQDSVQEAFVRAWMRWNRVSEQNPAAWVRTVAWNLAVSDWRSTVRQRSRLRLLAAERTVEEPHTDSIVAVRTSLSELTSDQQTAVVLHYFEDMSVEEIAAITGKPEGTVKSHLHRARSRLRELLEEGEVRNGRVDVGTTQGPGEVSE
jgi:RNA polymerase sigma-70 factor, ECF subfamily